MAQLETLLTENDTEFAQWLVNQRTLRHVQYELSSCFDLINRQYSFARLNGFSKLLTYLAQLSDQNELKVLENLQREQTNWNILSLVFAKLLEILSSNSSALLEQWAVDEIVKILELFQGYALLFPKISHEFFLSCVSTGAGASGGQGNKTNILIIVDMLSTFSENGTIILNVMETLQCVLVDCNLTLTVSNPLMVKLLQSVADLLKKRSIREDIIHSAIEVLYVYLAPEKPLNVQMTYDQEVAWLEHFKQRRKLLEGVVGDTFVKQLLSTVGIGTIRLKPSSNLNSQ
jgi:hypothetical protein